MKKATRNGIYYNLNDTEYSCRFIYYPGNAAIQSIRYYFSSAFYLALFQKKAAENREKVKESFRKKFAVQLNGYLLADLQLYQRTEKRGFRLGIVEYGKVVEVHSIDEIVLFVKGVEKNEAEANKVDSCGQCSTEK